MKYPRKIIDGTIGSIQPALSGEGQRDFAAYQ